MYPLLRGEEHANSIRGQHRRAYGVVLNVYICVYIYNTYVYIYIRQPGLRCAGCITESVAKAYYSNLRGDNRLVSNVLLRKGSIARPKLHTSDGSKVNADMSEDWLITDDLTDDRSAAGRGHGYQQGF